MNFKTRHNFIKLITAIFKSILDVFKGTLDVFKSILGILKCTLDVKCCLKEVRALKTFLNFSYKSDVRFINRTDLQIGCNKYTYVNIKYRFIAWSIIFFYLTLKKSFFNRWLDTFSDKSFKQALIASNGVWSIVTLKKKILLLI